MSEPKSKRGFRPLADMTSGLMDPMLQKRAGINLSLLQSWEDIVGPAIGATSRPLRILWPRRLHEDDPFKPATLIIACEGFAALQIQHETGEIISRVNGFLGFSAIGRIRIEQKRKVARDGLPQRRDGPRPMPHAASDRHGIHGLQSKSERARRTATAH